MQRIKQGHLIAVRRRIFILAVSDTNLQSRQPGVTGWTRRVCKPGGTEGAAAGADLTELDAADMPGIYYYEPTTGEIDTPGLQSYKFSKAGIEPREVTVEIEPAFFATAITGTLANNSFTTDRAETTNDFWKDALVRFLTGSLTGQVKKIGGYVGSSKRIDLATGLAFTAAPANNDICEIITA